jgi:hypothetical protein
LQEEKKAREKAEKLSKMTSAFDKSRGSALDKKKEEEERKKKEDAERRAREKAAAKVEPKLDSRVADMMKSARAHGIFTLFVALVYFHTSASPPPCRRHRVKEQRRPCWRSVAWRRWHPCRAHACLEHGLVLAIDDSVTSGCNSHSREWRRGWLWIGRRPGTW